METSKLRILILKNNLLEIIKQPQKKKQTVTTRLAPYVLVHVTNLAVLMKLLKWVRLNLKDVKHFAVIIVWYVLTATSLMYIQNIFG